MRAEECSCIFFFPPNQFSLGLVKPFIFKMSFDDVIYFQKCLLPLWRNSRGLSAGLGLTLAHIVRRTLGWRLARPCSRPECCLRARLSSRASLQLLSGISKEPPTACPLGNGDVTRLILSTQKYFSACDMSRVFLQLWSERLWASHLWLCNHLSDDLPPS